MSCFDKAVWLGECELPATNISEIHLLGYLCGCCLARASVWCWQMQTTDYVIFDCVCARVHGLLIIEGWKPESFRASWIWSFLDWNFGNGSRLRRKKKLLSAVRLVGGGTSSFSLVDDLLWTRDTLFLIQWVPSTPGRVEVRGRSWGRLLLSQH